MKDYNAFFLLSIKSREALKYPSPKNWPLLSTRRGQKIFAITLNIFATQVSYIMKQKHARE